MFGLLVTVASDTTTDGEPLFFLHLVLVFEVGFGALLKRRLFNVRNASRLRHFVRMESHAPDRRRH